MTGASGFVGPYLLQHLSEAGDETVGTGGEQGPDLLDKRAWEEFVGQHQPDVIYHLAGWSDVGRSWEKPCETFRLNTEGSMNVLNAARTASKTPTRVIVVSSADVYGTVTAEELPLTETSEIKPRSPYGVSKESAEALARQFHRGFGMDTVIARPFNHIGPGQSVNFAAPAFAARIAECELSGGGAVSHGDLTARRDFTDVRDVVRAYRLLAVHGQPGQTYNICSNQETAIGDLLQLLIDLAAVPIETERDPQLTRPVDLAVHRGCHDRLTEISGWSPTIPLKETLADVLAEARANVAKNPSSIPDTA